MITVIQTRTIKVKYAKLPQIDLNNRYMVEVLEPVPQVASEMYIYGSSVLNIIPGYEIQTLKEQLLANWKDQFPAKLKDQLPAWIYEVDSVDLIECDLLVPKQPEKLT